MIRNAMTPARRASEGTASIRETGPFPRLHVGLVSAALMFVMNAVIVAQDDVPPPRPVPQNPVLVQLRESAPATLDQLTRALRITSQLDAVEEFKLYAADWLKLTPSDADLTALSRKYGADFFFELSRREDLRPEGEQVGTAVLAAASKFARDPARLSDLINKLSDPATRPAAIRGLRDAGDAGIMALIRALADDTFKADRPAVRDGLAALGRDSVEPLIATLSAPLPETRADAAIVLGRLNARQSLPYLIGLAATDEDSPERAAAREALQRMDVPTPSARQASKLLEKRMQSLLAGELVGNLDAADQIPLWRWDEEARTVRLDRYPRQQASLVVANRLARPLNRLADDPAHARLALLVQLEADHTFAGLDQPLPQGPGTAWELAYQQGIEALEASLVDAIELNRPTAIAAVIEVLGASGRSELLAGQAGRESPLVVALGYPDRRVQVAALKAILALDPLESYPGSSRVIETMQYLLTSSGQPRVLIGHPRLDDSNRIATLFSTLGYTADRASTGRSLIQQAKEHADYELILISETIDGPIVQETVQSLRKDPRTARIPLGIMEHFVVLAPKVFLPELRFGRDHKKLVEPLTAQAMADLMLADPRHAPQRLSGGKAERAAEVVDLAIVVPQPQTPEGLRFVHDQVMGLAPTRFVAPEIRLEQTYFVLEQLAGLLSREHPPAFYDFKRVEEQVIAASQVPPLAAQAARVLGLLATPEAQLTLVEQASLRANSGEDREAASKAFAEAVRRRGLLLTQVQLTRLYDMYERASDEQRPRLRELLDVIEAPTAEVRAEQRKLFDRNE